MTEESPIRNVDSYQFPDKYFEKLYELETNGPRYSIVQGGLYDSLREDHRFSAVQAMDVSRALNNGEVEEAENLVENVLEPGEE